MKKKKVLRKIEEAENKVHEMYMSLGVKIRVKRLELPTEPIREGEPYQEQELEFEAFVEKTNE